MCIRDSKQRDHQLFPRAPGGNTPQIPGNLQDNQFTRTDHLFHEPADLSVLHCSSVTSDCCRPCPDCLEGNHSFMSHVEVVETCQDGYATCSIRYTHSHLKSALPPNREDLLELGWRQDQRAFHVWTRAQVAAEELVDQQ